MPETAHQNREIYCVAEIHYTQCTRAQHIVPAIVIYVVIGCNDANNIEMLRIAEMQRSNYITVERARVRSNNGNRAHETIGRIFFPSAVFRVFSMGELCMFVIA